MYILIMVLLIPSRFNTDIDIKFKEFSTKESCEAGKVVLSAMFDDDKPKIECTLK